MRQRILMAVTTAKPNGLVLNNLTKETKAKHIRRAEFEVRHRKLSVIKCDDKCNLHIFAMNFEAQIKSFRNNKKLTSAN